MKLPHGRELLEIIPLAELYTTYKDHDRLTVFANKGRVCAACGREGTFIIRSLETPRSKQSRNRKSVGSIHIDLYTDDFVLMTVDHITPKYIAKIAGWNTTDTESLNNKQPMCDPCNNRKGHKDIPLEELARRSKMAYTARKKNGQFAAVEVIRDLVDNIHRLMGDDEILAGSVGFEPTLMESKSTVLPLDDKPIVWRK